MSFLMTFYIYPLQESMMLSSKLGFSLDNPRTQEEIATVADYLQRSHDSGYDITLPEYSDEPIVSLEYILFSFRDTFSSEDEHIADFFKRYERNQIFDFLASMWIIARFDDQGNLQELQEAHRRMEMEGQRGFFLLDDNHPLIKNEENLANYASLLSLLVHSEGDDYFGRPFVIDPERIDRTRPPKSLWMDFMVFGMASRGHKKQLAQESLRWVFLPYALDDIQRTAASLDKVFDEGATEKLLYIGSLLKTVSYEITDQRFRLIVLTSILELLLTHNPDTGRFNVEDSINKQFQLKTSILVYLNNKQRDIEQIKRRLKIIYQQRSAIAHGNFAELGKYKSKLSKKEGKEEYFDDLIVDLYVYIRAILEEFLKDKKFIDFIKEN